MKRIIGVWDTLKYAKRDVSLYRILSIISLVVTIVFIVFFILFNAEVIRNDSVAVWVMLGTPCSIIFFLGVLGLYLDAKTYISDLDKKGYIVPETRKDCDYRLSMLLRDEQEPPVGKIYKRHMILGIVAGVITLIVTVYNFTWAKRPHPLAIILMLIVTGVIFWQSFNRFFKNDIDIDVEDSRMIRQRIVPSVVGVAVLFFVIWMGTMLFSVFPVGNELYYAQIVRYHKRENPEDYRFYMDRLPSYAEDVDFISWGNACGVSFYVPQENVKDIQAYYENIGEQYIIHTIEEGEEEFIRLCEEIKQSTTYFESEDFENCMVYEFPNWYVDQWGHTGSWYAIMDTNSGEVGYGSCPTDW